MRIIELEKNKETNHSLVAMVREDFSLRQFAVCNDYNPSAKENEWWSSAEYFTSLEGALDYWYSRVLSLPTYGRLSAIASLLYEFSRNNEDANLEIFLEETLTDEEREYFEL